MLAMSPELNEPYQRFSSTSAAHYALLFLPQAQRAPLQALFHLDQTLRHAMRRVSDISLALGKHVFWQEELRALSSKAPLRHPLSSYLQNFEVLTNQSLGVFLQREAMLMEQTRFLDEPNLQDYLSLQAQCWQVWQNVYTQLIGAPAVDISSLAVQLERARIVCQLGKDAQEGRIFIPVNTLQAFDIRAAYLINHQPHTTINLWLTQEVANIESQISAQIRSMSTADRYHSRPFLIFLHIARRRLKKALLLGENVIKHPASLMPIQKFYSAWKIWVFSRYL